MQARDEPAVLGASRAFTASFVLRGSPVGEATATCILDMPLDSRLQGTLDILRLRSSAQGGLSNLIINDLIINNSID